MPLYEYECLKCGAVFEEIQKFSDPLMTVHPGCGGQVKKLLSAPAIQFKGTGWYITDYARAGKSDPDSKKNDKKEKKEAKAESKGESKGESTGSSESKAASSESTKATTTEASKK